MATIDSGFLSEVCIEELPASEQDAASLAKFMTCTAAKAAGDEKGAAQLLPDARDKLWALTYDQVEYVVARDCAIRIGKSLCNKWQYDVQDVNIRPRQREE